MIIQIKNWSRKHTLVSLFLFMLVGVGAYFAYDMYVAPQKAIAEQAASAPLPEKAPALTPEEKAATDLAVPRTDNAPDIMQDLERIAGETGVSIVSTEASGAGMGGRGRLVADSLTAQVSSPDSASITAFLAGLAANPRYIQVDSVRIKQEDGIRLDLGITTFTQ